MHTPPPLDEPDRLDGLIAWVGQSVRNSRIEGDGVARPQQELVEADVDLERSAEDVAPLLALVALERIGRGRGAADFVRHEQEIDVAEGLRRQSLPLDSPTEPDPHSGRSPLDGVPG